MSGRIEMSSFSEAVYSLSWYHFPVQVRNTQAEAVRVDFMSHVSPPHPRR